MMMVALVTHTWWRAEEMGTVSEKTIETPFVVIYSKP